MAKKFYEFKQSENDEAVDLYVFGEITSFGWEDSDVGAFDFAKDLEEHKGKHMTVHINSYGGEVAEGLAIYNMLKATPNVTTVCDGFACSAASVIFMAGQNRVMNEGSLLMIHNAWTVTAGDSNALRKAAEDLERITQPSVEIYKSNSNLSEETIKELMDAETWILPEEALAWGFCTEVKKASANQSINEQYLNKAIHKAKDLELRIAELEEQLKAKEEPLDPWAEYFKKEKR